MKKVLIVLIMLLLINSISFAVIKTFIKEGTAVVPANQTQEQVIDYLKQKLTREATEEAGIFIKTRLNIQNNKITQDDFTSVAGSISRIEILEEEPFTEDRKQYVKVKLRIKLNTERVKIYLRKIMQDESFRQENEELRQKNLELENRLKKATKKQYEQELSEQVQQQIELQKQRAIELNKMAIQAKEEYAKAKQNQKQKELERQQEINALQKQIELDTLKTQQKIAQEKDNIKKAELENQAKIKELENKAKENMINWQQTTNKTTIEQAIKEATKIKKEVNILFDKFENLLQTNKENLIKSYDTQIDMLKNTKFQEEEPIKDSWETQNEYNARLQKYEYNKEIFEENADKKIKELEQTKDDNLLKEELGTSNSTINTTKPFIDKLKYFQTEKFYSKDGIKAKLISIGEINAEDKYFVLNVNYENKDYSLKYDFSNIGREKAKLMCQTQNQFVIEPLFSVNNNLTKELTSFNIRHLGTSQEKDINIVTKVNQLDEIKLINLYIQNFKEKEKELNTNKQIRQYFNFDVEPYELFISDEKFNSVYLNDECVILKKGNHIRVYYSYKYFRDYKDSIISYDMDRIAAFNEGFVDAYDIEGNLIVHNGQTHNYGLFFLPDDGYDNESIICYQSSKADKYGYEQDRYISLHRKYEIFNNGLGRAHDFIYIDGKNYKKQYDKFDKDIEQVSYFNSTGDLNILVDKKILYIKNQTINKVYKQLKFDEEITSANFSNNGKKIVILLNQKKVLLWNFSN